MAMSAAGHTWYERPTSAPVTLRHRPRPASWDASASQSQRALSGYLSDAEARLRGSFGGLAAPWGLRLNVGFPPETNLLATADADNYVYPLVRYLSRAAAEAPPGLCSVWCTKLHTSASSVQLGPVREKAPPAHPYTVRTTASSESIAFKEQVQQGVTDAALLAPGPVELEVSFRVGRRNWLNLWKPTIDALDPLLGRTISTRKWHPQDGRITTLGLHLTVDMTLRYDVDLQLHVNPGE